MSDAVNSRPTIAQRPALLTPRTPDKPPETPGALVALPTAQKTLTGADEHGIAPVQIREETLEIVDLRQIVVDDVRIRGVERQEILVVALRRIERAARFDPGDDGPVEDVGLVQLPDVGLRDVRLFL